MKVTIRETAADDLDGIFAWIAQHNPRAAAGVLRRLRSRIERLGTPGFAHIGRQGLVRGTRELVEPPYIIVYTVDDRRQEVVIIGIFHGAQDRAPER